MPKKPSKAATDPTAAKPTEVAYILCRWWPYFASYFPFAQFDDLADDELKAALSAYGRDLAVKHEDAIKKWREDRAKGNAARTAGQMGLGIGPRHAPPAPEAAKAKALTLFQICEAIGFVARNSMVVHEKHWGSGFGPTASAVIHRTTLSRASDVAKAVSERCLPPEGRYRFRVVPQASLTKAEYIRFQREYQLLEVARLPLVRPEKLLAKRAEAFGQTATGVPHWAIPLRDEAIAIDGILGAQMPDSAAEPTAVTRQATRRRPPGVKAPRGFIFVQDAETEFKVADSTINDWAADAENNLRPNKDKIAGLKYVHRATLKALIKKRRSDKG